MSSIHNRITTTFTASGGQAIAVMGEISGAMMNIGRQSGQMGQQVGQAERGFRALGTTIRYALAGTVAFALPNMVRQLSDVQQQLGLMTAIGTGPGGIPIVGQQLRQLGNDAQAGAINAITPISDFNDAVINFLSTVQNVPPSQVPSLVTEIAQAAKLSQTPVEDATKAFTTMSVAFGRPLTGANARTEIHKTAQEFFQLTQEAPGGIQAGPQIIQQLGQLAQVTRLAGGTRPQLFGLLLSTLRSGIPPAQAGRGLQYLLQTIGLPGQGSKESEQTLASIGIRAGNREALMPKLNRIFQHARQLSFRGNLGQVARLDEDTLSQFDTTGGSASLLKGLGITGPGAVFLGQIFHRVHALRTALALLGQFDTGQYQKDIKGMADAESGHVKDIHDMGKAWDKFRKQAKLKEAATALSVLQLQIAQTFQPILDPIAGGLTATAKAAQHHRDATRYTTYGVGGLLALLGLNRLRGGAGFGLGRLFRGAGRVAPGAMALESALSGQIPKGTATDPLYVITMTDVFGGRRGPGGGIPGMLERNARKGLPVAGGLTLGETAAGLGVAAAITAGVVAPVAAGIGIAKLFGGHGTGFHTSGGRGHPLLNRYLRQGVGVAPGGGQDPAMAGITDILMQYRRGGISASFAENLLRKANSTPRIRSGNFSAIQDSIAGALKMSGIAELELIYNQPDGTKARKKVHVRTDNWGNGNTPQHRGQPKTKNR